MNLSKELDLMRKAREEIWTSFLRKAKGDSEKAVKLMQKEAEKIYKQNPEFWE